MQYQLNNKASFDATDYGENSQRCRHSINDAWSGYYSNQGYSSGPWAEMGMLSTWRSGDWSEMCKSPKSQCQDPASCHDAPCGTSPPNSNCGGYHFWGGKKEGPNGMGRNSPGTMWVRERE